MKQQYDNEIRRQCMDIVHLALPQFDASAASFAGLIPADVLRGLRRVIVTGCGDSYLAAVEASGAFQKYLAGSGCRMEYARAIDAARYMDLGGGGTLLVAVSASGGPARIAEILERGKRRGCVTVALTNTADSRAARTADYAYLTNTPPFPDNMPGLRNYFASLVSLFVMAAAMGEALGQTGAVVQLRNQLEAYNDKFAPLLEAIDEAAFGAAKAWQGGRGFEAVADGPLFACAGFIAAKYAEVSGDKCTVCDSENYCHVNAITRPKGALGTYALAFSHERNISRLADTVNQQVEQELRPVFVIADKPAAQLGITAPVRECVLPSIDPEFAFLYLLYAYIPGSLAAGYHAALIHEPYFRGGGVFFDPAVNTLKTNSIRVI